jgi:hypothetical protein
MSFEFPNTIEEDFFKEFPHFSYPCEEIPESFRTALRYQPVFVFIIVVELFINLSGKLQF